jgi:hypothetical protein
MTQAAASPLVLVQMQRRAWLVGAAGVVLALLGVWLNLAQFFRAYLVAYLFWSGLSLGCLALLMLHHLVGGAWGAMIRRLLEAGTRTLPLMVVLFVPLLYGLTTLYSWSQPEVVAHDGLLQHKSVYLNIPFFVQRAALYFAIWLIVMFFLNYWSRQQEQVAGAPQERRVQRRLRLLSAPGLVLYVLTVTFAAVDWIMSLEPHWYSTLYGVVILVGQILAALALAIVLITQLAEVPPVSTVLTLQHLHDLGNLLLAFVMFWAYIAFSQFLIIWSGNLPEEVSWYIHRTQGGWEWLGGLVLLLHFGLPFVVLLSRTSKRRAQVLWRIAAGLLGLHLLELFWLVLPAFYPSTLAIHWLDVGLPIGMGGLWMAVFVWQLQRRSLLPWHDPRLQEVVHHG